MRRLASTLAGRRPFAVEAAIGTTEHESRGLVEVEPEIAGLLDWSTDELRLAGANCIARDRRWVSAATCPSEPWRRERRTPAPSAEPGRSARQRRSGRQSRYRAE